MLLRQKSHCYDAEMNIQILKNLGIMELNYKEFFINIIIIK